MTSCTDLVKIILAKGNVRLDATVAQSVNNGSDGAWPITSDRLLDTQPADAV
jgi:hypothetical protein